MVIAILVVKRKAPHVWWGLNFYGETGGEVGAQISYFRRSSREEIAQLKTVDSVDFPDRPLVGHPLLKIKVYEEFYHWVAEVEKDEVVYQFMGEDPVSLLRSLEEGLPRILDPS